MKFAFNTIVFREWDLSKVIPLLKRYGYDGVEVAWIPPEHPFYTGRDINVIEIKKICDYENLEIASICPFYPDPYDISSVSESKRRIGVDYVKRIIDVACEINAGIVVLVPSAVFTQPSGAFSEIWSSCLKSLRELESYIGETDVKIALEPITRFLTHFVTRVDQATGLVNDAKVSKIGVLADVFHMNIEEKSIEESLKQSRDYLAHVHVSDSNNFVPGTGHLNFDTIFKVLSELNYDGYVSAELGVDLSEAADAAEMTIKFLRNYK